MNKIALHGSYFGYNFGDTLLCALFCQWIHSNTCAKVVLPIASRRNMALIGADARGLASFLSCPYLVFCGGGYFGGPAKASFKWSVRNFFRHFLIAELARLMGKKILVLGTGAGPIASPFLRDRLKRLVEYAEVVIVRDDESKAFLNSLGVTREIVVDIDAATYLDRSFFVPRDEGSATPVSERTALQTKRTVVIHLTNYDSPEWEPMANVMAEFCSRSQGITPLIITDSQTRTGKAAAQDKASRQLERLIPGSQHVGYAGDPAELCRLLDTADLIVTNKLHVGIVGSKLGKHVISLPQHVKTPRFYRQLGLSSICVVEKQAEGLHSLLRLWQSGGLPRAHFPVRDNVYASVIAARLGVDG